jgi:MFS family permease
MTQDTRVPEPWFRSALAPFRTRMFRAIWIATVASNVGSLVQTVGAAWLMVSLSHSSDMVALVQASTALPIMLLAVPAGAIADIWDRRHLMLVAQVLMAVTSVLLTVLAYAHALGPWSLLGLTFLLGCGTALYAPAWQSAVGEQVPAAHIPAAVSLNAISFNTARTLGPAIGGLIVAAEGPPAAFLLNALSYAGILVVLLRWRRPRTVAALPPESMFEAMRAGIRYARMSPPIRTVLSRCVMFGFLASGVWATMPLVALDLLGGGPLTYGFLLGSFGVGGVLTAFGSAWLRRLYSSDTLATAGTLVYGVATVVIAQSHWLALSAPAFLLCGASWVLSFATFNITTQTSAPRWVVGRMLAIYQALSFGAMAAGSWLWGEYIEFGGLTASLTTSGLLLAASLLLVRRWPLHPTNVANLHPHQAAVAPEKDGIDPASGPIVSTVEYRVAPADAAEFLVLAHELGRIRRRDGARRWSLLQDLEDPRLWLERFQTDTWLEHLRHSGRATLADQELREQVSALHLGPEPPRARHLVARRPEVPAPAPNAAPPG